MRAYLTPHLPMRLKLMLILQRKEKPWNLDLIVESILKSSPMKMELVKPNASIVQKFMQLLHHLMVRYQ